MQILRIAAICITSLLVATSSYAASHKLYLGAYGGSTEKLMKDEILPAWEKANDTEVVYVPGNSTSTLAKLQAQKGNQELDVVFLDDGPMFQAISLGLCAPIKASNAFDDVYDIARMGTKNAIGIGFVATGLAYNAKYFKEKGWAPPSSWSDLADSKYKGKLVVPPVTNTYGLHALVMTARLHGGSENDIDKGFSAFSNSIADNVLTFEPSSGKLSELFQNNEVVIAAWGSGRLKSLADTGFPGAFAYPKEGAVALMVATCPVVESDVPDQAQSLIQYLVSAEIQEKIAASKAWGPTNRHAKLSATAAKALPYGPDKIKALETVDWDVINPARADWTKRWTREIER